MSTFPNLADLLAPSNEGTFQTAITALLNRAKELPGGSAQTELTISGGVVTPTVGNHSIDTQGDSSSDDLDNILLTNTPAGSLIFIRAENASRTVVIKHLSGGAGQISTVDGSDISLDDIKVWVGLLLIGTTWEVVFVGQIPSATQSQMEAASSNSVSVTPGNAKWHPGVGKAWINGSYSGGVPQDDASYNVASLDDDGTGLIGINFSTNMSTANYSAVVNGYNQGQSSQVDESHAYGFAVGSVDISLRVAGSAADADFCVTCHGDQ